MVLRGNRPDKQKPTKKKDERNIKCRQMETFKEKRTRRSQEGFSTKDSHDNG